MYIYIQKQNEFEMVYSSVLNERLVLDIIAESRH